VINMVLDVDIPAQRNVKREAIPKLKKLLYILCNSVPFKPNIQKLSDITGISRNTIVTYLNYLEEKIFLENTNLNFALSDISPQTGNLREGFFFNQIKKDHKLTHPKKGDFIIDNKFTFEIGGKNKISKQVAGASNAYIAVDDVEIGFGNKIPLWLFGFLY